MMWHDDANEKIIINNKQTDRHNNYKKKSRTKGTALAYRNLIEPGPNLTNKYSKRWWVPWVLPSYSTHTVHRIRISVRIVHSIQYTVYSSIPAQYTVYRYRVPGCWLSAWQVSGQDQTFFRAMTEWNQENFQPIVSANFLPSPDWQRIAQWPCSVDVGTPYWRCPVARIWRLWKESWRSIPFALPAAAQHGRKGQWENQIMPKICVLVTRLVLLLPLPVVRTVLYNCTTSTG